MGDNRQPHALSYILPPDNQRRVVERYSLDNNDDNDRRMPSKYSANDSQHDTATPRSRPTTPQPPTTRPASPRPSARSRSRVSQSSRPSPGPQLDIQPSSSSPATQQFPPIIPLSASPTYSPPVAPNYRTYPQQPTYVTQSISPNPIQPVYTPMVPQDEPCVECAMRDQEMADVDVTSPGVWDRASDAQFEELKQRELEDEANGVVVDDPSRIRIRGGRLTEENLKLWLSINPREPTSRQQTLIAYIKSQRSLLEAEALAHARTLKEAKQLDSRVRDAYIQIRQSAYDLGTAAHPADDTGAVRIKSPPSAPHDHGRSRSREVTLLENGMIVEHVDVRKEEREARERKKKEERRARKSSRSSVLDVTSVISAQSGGQLPDNNLKPYSRYSHASSARPTSILTTPPDRPDIPRAYSQASFSDVHSMGSSSPRRTRFFGFKNLSAGWRSQDSLAPSGMSGSMMDMHVALQRENVGPHPLTASPIDLNTPRRSQIWYPPELDDPTTPQTPSEDKAKKKKGGLAKIWRIVTGSGKSEQQRHENRQQGQNDDDFPLTPPPPMSVLVDRGPLDHQSGGNVRHTSNPSLPSIASPKFGLSSPGMSPPTAPSSLLPSPVSMRPTGLDADIADTRQFNDGPIDDQALQDDTVGKTQGINIRSIQSEFDLRSPGTGSMPSSPLPTSASANGTMRSLALSREKSLPPLPPGEAPALVLPSDRRPQTVYALPPGTSPPHDFLPPQAPFRTGDVRRQSFGGTSSRPNLSVHTMPTPRTNGFDASRQLGPRYDEFGISRRSLARLEYVDEDGPRSTSPIPSKRKSKFGLSTLLGKKEKRELDIEKHQFPTMGGPHDAQDDIPLPNGQPTPGARHSVFGSAHPNTRMSVSSRKALEERVQQDAEFVAYRYPSNDQRLDLLR